MASCGPPGSVFHTICSNHWGHKSTRLFSRPRSRVRLLAGSSGRRYRRACGVPGTRHAIAVVWLDLPRHRGYRTRTPRRGTLRLRTRQDVGRVRCPHGAARSRVEPQRMRRPKMARPSGFDRQRNSSGLADTSCSKLPRKDRGVYRGDGRETSKVDNRGRRVTRAESETCNTCQIRSPTDFARAWITWT